MSCECSISISTQRIAFGIRTESEKEHLIRVSLGYQELTGKRPDYVEIYELEEQKRKPRSVDDDFISTVKKNVKNAATSLRQGLLLAKPSEKSCNVCDFKLLCSEGSHFTSKRAGKSI
jgi:DNA helicase-2/ATP-dependent DNA helicase PcrA